MHYWRKVNYEGLPLLATDADQAGYGHFAEYCRLRERGLRKNAFEVLSLFISEMLAVPGPQRRKFVEWHQAHCFLNPALMDALPQPLEEKIIRPTVEEWINECPNDPLALRWSNKVSDLRRAAELNPGEEIAAIKLAKVVLSGIDYATHELPSGYLGENPEEGLADLEFVMHYLSLIKKTIFRDPLLDEAKRLQRLIQNYLDGTG